MTLLRNQTENVVESISTAGGSQRPFKRLLLVIPSVSSLQMFLGELCDALAASGVEVHCACSDVGALGETTPESIGNVTIHPVSFPRGMNPFAHWKASTQLRRLVAELRPDVIHAHFSAGIFTTALARGRDWPVTLGTFQGIRSLASGGHQSQLLRIAEGWAAHRMDQAWVLTDDDRKGLEEMAPGVRVFRQRSFGFGCDLNVFDPDKISEAAQADLRMKLGLRPEDFVLAFVGRFVEFKGFAMVLRAFFQLAEHNPHLRLLLVGNRDKLHPTGLVPQERRRQLDSKQIVDAGFQRDVRPYLAISNVVVFPSEREGMPVCLMEALSMGVPVITRNARGCRDVVRDQIDGLVLPICNTNTLAASMKMLLDRPEMRTSMSQQALAGRERFDRQNYVTEQIDIYQSLLATAPAM